LGFSHICGRSRAGRFLLKRKSRRDRMRTKLRTIKEELRQRMHESIPEQGKWLAQVVRGYFAYHAVPTNARSLGAFLHYVKHLWQRALRRRSQKDGTTWERMADLAAEFLPKPRVLHPWPDERFLATYPRWKPSAQIGPARFCSGGEQ
jgi:RNA-directed DNA polymerase